MVPAFQQILKKRAVFSNYSHPFLFLEAYKKLLAIPGSPAARGLGKTPSLYQRTIGGNSIFLLSCQKRGVLILCQVMGGRKLFFKLDDFFQTQKIASQLWDIQKWWVSVGPEEP